MGQMLQTGHTDPRSQIGDNCNPRFSLDVDPLSFDSLQQETDPIRRPTDVALDKIYPARRWGIGSCVARFWLLDSRRERLSTLYTTMHSHGGKESRVSPVSTALVSARPGHGASVSRCDPCGRDWPVGSR
jgi:hypothetical protein